ncbi:MAG: hypothetical protein OXG24_00705 [Gammaproteobacteria bacterium]|nr:hypothetical protein [Gammaproteobacteria bacterium]
MEKINWQTKRLSVVNLFLDEENPRLGRETGGQAPREIIQYLFDHDKALDVARSIAIHGYFENEPLLAIRDGRHHVVVEGNRRLAALKALKEPWLLMGKIGRQVERLSRQANLEAISKVPVTIAPNRRSTDRLISVRHIGTPVLAWQAENRASFILSKLEEGYSNDELHDVLGFTEQDIQKAKQTRAIAEMARALDLPDEIKAKVDNPRVKLFSTLERVFDSSVGREFLKVIPDAEHGLRGVTTKKEFLRAFTNLVKDIALQKETSRSLNTNANIREYFEKRNPDSVAIKKRGKFVPGDIIQGKSVTSPKPPSPPEKPKPTSKTVLPSSLKVRFGNDRLVDIRRELIALKRSKYPNAGAVLLRVFLELAIKEYLQSTGELQLITKKLKAKRKLPSYGMPPMKILAQRITEIAKRRLSKADATMVEKALRHDPAAPFSINDLHAFVHHTDFPGERDILQFWKRTEPLFRMMLEQGPEDPNK